MIKTESVFLKGHKGQVILDNISIEVHQGDACGFVGQNGSGKSMLLKTICGFVKPDKGRVLVDGKEIGKELDFIPDTGVVFDSAGFLPGLSGYKNLLYLAQIKNKIGKKEILEVMDYVGLGGEEKKKVKHYSLGMKQKLAFASAIMEGPSILILDEPFNGLDKASCEKLRGMLLNLKKQKKTILLSSHIADDIHTICDYVYEIDNGKIESRVSYSEEEACHQPNGG